MKIEFDPAKSGRNATERGLPFDRVGDFDWDTALVAADNRFPYTEPRFVAVGLIGERLHVVCFTPITGGIRVISFRKANTREAKYHEQKTIDRQEW